MHTGSTDNYSLSQFASTDKPAWLVDYNEDMRKIDAGMKGNADAIETLGESIGQEGEDITDLKERMAVAEQDIDTAQETIGTGELETEVKNLIGAANELLGLIQDNDSDITALQQGLAGVGDAIDGVAQLAYTIANVYDSTQTYGVGSYAIYQNTLYKCITPITVGEAFNPAKWTSVKVMNEVGSGGGTSYTAGAGIGITNNVISFNGNTAPYDNTDSGLSATTVKGAIDELATATPSSTPDITITADGVKTLKTIFNELANAIDPSKIKNESVIVEYRGSEKYVLHNFISFSGGIKGGLAFTDEADRFTMLGYKFSRNINNCIANTTTVTASGVTVVDESSRVAGSGDKFEVYY